MRKLVQRVGLVLVFALGYYLYAESLQVKAAARVCEQLEPGTARETALRLGREQGLDVKGPFLLDEASGTERVVFCVSMSFCDTSCTVELHEGLVLQASFVSL